MRIAEGPQLQRPQPNNLRTSSPTEHAFVRIAGTTTAVSTANGFPSAVRSPTTYTIVPLPSSPLSQPSLSANCLPGTFTGQSVRAADKSTVDP